MSLKERLAFRDAIRRDAIVLEIDESQIWAGLQSRSTSRDAQISILRVWFEFETISPWSRALVHAF